nr:hypothetical protein [Tanacetum cinerariifolium]
MDMTINQQVALDEALVPHAYRLRIRRSNFRLLSDISSKESTLQLVYDVLRQNPFFKAFLVTADVQEIYMQEFWATATVHHHSICYHQQMLNGKSSCYDSLRLSQVQFLWGFYHKRNAYFGYLLWEDFVYQVKHKDTKKSNEMYYPRDDQMFTMIKLVSRYQNMQQFDAMLPIELTNNEIRNFEAYKEHYAVATGATPPKTKASVRKTKSSSDTTVTPPPTVVVGTRLFTFAKGKQPATTSKAKSLTALSEVAMTEAQQLKLATKRSLQRIHISQASGSGVDEGTDTNKDDDDQEGGDAEDDQEEGSDDEQAFDEEGKEFIHPSLSTHDEEETRDEERFDPIPKTHENTNDEGNGIESMFETSSQMDVQPQTIVAPLPMTAPTLTPSTIAIITTVQQAPTPLTTAPSTLLQDLPNFGLIIQRYMDQRMNEAVKVAIQIQFDRLRNEVQAGNDEFLKTIDENMHKIIKEQVKEHVKVQVFKILLKIEQTVNEQLEAKVLIQSSNSSKTSYAVAVDLSKIEIKKILIEKMEGNKYIYQSNDQRNIYKALVEAYESDKIILDTYGDTFTLKRRRDDDEDKDEEPSAGSDRGSTRRREGKEPESASAPKEKATRSAGKSTQGSKSRQTSASEFATADEPMQTPHEMEEPSHPEFETSADDQPIDEPSQHPEWFSQQNKPPTPDLDWNKTLPATYGSIQPWISELAKQTDSRSSFNELMDTPVDFSAFLINQLKVDTLTLKLLAGRTYELMKGSCKSLVELEFFLEKVYKATTDQLDWVNPEGHQNPHNLLKPLPLIPNSQGRRIIPFDHFINNDLEYLRGGVSSHKYTTSVTKTKAADYGHIKDDDKLYKFKEGDFKRLCIQDIEDMLLPLVQGKLTNLIVEERFAFNVSLQMFTRSIVIQRRVEDLQLGVESYQKKLNLTRPDTYRSYLKCKEAYIAYSNPRGFIHQNKDKHNRLM